MTARLVVAAVLLVLLSACANGPRVQRDTEIDGVLPRVIGLGAFASNCLFLCFVSSTTTQGDLIAQPAEPSELTMHRHLREDLQRYRRKSP